MNAATTHILKRLMILAAAAAVVALVVARSATSDDTPSASGQDAADAVVVVDAFPDLAGEGTGWPDCPGCDGEFRAGDALLASDDPLPTLDVQLTTADGVTRTATTRDMTEGRQQAVFELPEPVDVTVTLTSIPEGWSRCGGVPARTRLTEADFDDDGRAAVAFAMGQECSAQQTPAGFADTLRKALDGGELDADVLEDGVLPTDGDEPTLAAAARALGLVSDTIASEGTGPGDDGSAGEPAGHNDGDIADQDDADQDDAGQDIADQDDADQDDADQNDDGTLDTSGPDGPNSGDAPERTTTDGPARDTAPTGESPDSSDDGPPSATSDVASGDDVLEGGSRDDAPVAGDGHDGAAEADAAEDDAASEDDSDVGAADDVDAAEFGATGATPGNDEGLTRTRMHDEEPTGDRLPGDREPESLPDDGRPAGASEQEPIGDMGRGDGAEVAAETREPGADQQPDAQAAGGSSGLSGTGSAEARRGAGEFDAAGDAPSAVQPMATSVATSAPSRPSTTKGGIPLGGHENGGILSGEVYLDRDLDGERSDADEPMIGIRVRLSSLEDVRVVRTDDDGAFRFEDLYGAAYDVVVEPPAGLSAVGAGAYGRLPVIGRVLEDVDFALTDRPLDGSGVDEDAGVRAAVPDRGPDAGGWMGPVCCADASGATWMAPFGPPMGPWAGVDGPRLPATGLVGTLPTPGWGALAAIAGVIGFVGLAVDTLRRRGRR